MFGTQLATPLHTYYDSIYEPLAEAASAAYPRNLASPYMRPDAFLALMPAACN
jgi:hypothetical protein